MQITKHIKLAAVTALTISAFAVSSTASAGSLAYSSVVSFGDSLSDVGTYRVSTIAAVGGGQYTVNGTGKNWSE